MFNLTLNNIDNTYSNSEVDQIRVLFLNNKQNGYEIFSH